MALLLVLCCDWLFKSFHNPFLLQLKIDNHLRHLVRLLRWQRLSDVTTSCLYRSDWPVWYL